MSDIQGQNYIRQLRQAFCWMGNGSASEAMVGSQAFPLTFSCHEENLFIDNILALKIYEEVVYLNCRSRAQCELDDCAFFHAI